MNRTSLALAVALALAGCGKTPEPTNANLIEAAKQLQSDGEPVSFETLQTFMPSNESLTADGWQKTDMTGMALSVPIKGAKASMTIRKADAEITIDIVDTVFNQSVYAPVAAFLAEGFKESSPNSFKQSIRFQEQPAFEEWTQKNQTATLTVLAGRRYLVVVTGKGLNSTAPVKSVATWIDMTKLAGLK